jgi:4-amino-4-deoxychorismate lyase
MSVKLLTTEDWLVALRQARGQAPGPYRAMYSSWLRGIVTAPELMVVPVDDHMVHRGDGVFEAARVVSGAVFDLDPHLARMGRSAERIGLRPPFNTPDIRSICLQTVAASGLREAALRLFVSRGPGGFSPDPYESKGSQLYIIATDFKPVAETKYQSGVRAMVSKVPQKSPMYSQIKSCNYLPNVLMKKEAVDHGFDFSLGCDESGRILEGATENMAMLDQDGVLRIPKFDYTLRGTTLLAVLDTLERQPDASLVKGIEFCDLKLENLRRAREVFMIGTTIEVLPVVEIADFKIDTGRPGPVAVELRRRLQKEMTGNSERRAAVSYIA